MSGQPRLPRAQFGIPPCHATCDPRYSSSRSCSPFHDHRRSFTREREWDTRLPPSFSLPRRAPSPCASKATTVSRSTSIANSLDRECWPGGLVTRRSSSSSLATILELSNILTKQLNELNAAKAEIQSLKAQLASQSTRKRNASRSRSRGRSPKRSKRSKSRERNCKRCRQTSETQSLKSRRPLPEREERHRRGFQRFRSSSRERERRPSDRNQAPRGRNFPETQKICLWEKEKECAAYDEPVTSAPQKPSRGECPSVAQNVVPQQQQQKNETGIREADVLVRTGVAEYIKEVAGAPDADEFELAKTGGKELCPASIRFCRRPHFSLGRSSQAGVHLPGVQCSRFHVQLVHSKENGQVYLIDLSSCHGTVLNGKPVPKCKFCPLSEGDEFCIGLLDEGWVTYKVASVFPVRPPRRERLNTSSFSSAPAEPIPVPREMRPVTSTNSESNALSESVGTIPAPIGHNDEEAALDKTSTALKEAPEAPVKVSNSDEDSEEMQAFPELPEQKRTGFVFNSSEDSIAEGAAKTEKKDSHGQILGGESFCVSDVDAARVCVESNEASESKDEPNYYVYQTGDMVLISKEHVNAGQLASSAHDGEGKCAAPVMGPLQVMEVLDQKHRYKLRLPQSEGKKRTTGGRFTAAKKSAPRLVNFASMEVHASALRLFMTKEELMKSSTASRTDEAVSDDDDNEMHIVQWVLDVQRKEVKGKKKRFALVAWEGDFPESDKYTWEPIKSVKRDVNGDLTDVHEAITDFYARQKAAAEGWAPSLRVGIADAAVGSMTSTPPLEEGSSSMETTSPLEEGSCTEEVEVEAPLMEKEQKTDEEKSSLGGKIKETLYVFLQELGEEAGATPWAIRRELEGRLNMVRGELDCWQTDINLWTIEFEETRCSPRSLPTLPSHDVDGSFGDAEADGRTETCVFSNSIFLGSLSTCPNAKSIDEVEDFSLNELDDFGVTKTFEEMGEDSIGWRVRIFWDGDRKWYYGHVIAFDPRKRFRRCVTVIYDDDDFQSEYLEDVIWMHKPVQPHGDQRKGWSVKCLREDDDTWCSAVVVECIDKRKVRVMYEDEYLSVEESEDLVWIAPLKEGPPEEADDLTTKSTDESGACDITELLETDEITSFSFLNDVH